MLKSEDVNGYRILKPIGEGQYGKVVHAQNQNNINFAIKMIPLNKLQINPELSMFYNHETHVLLRLTHPNIIEFIESFTHKGNMWIIYEYCDKGSLKMNLTLDGAVPEQKAIYITYCVAKALEYMAADGMIHRDVKPDNVLIKDNCVKLADFGFCTQDKLQDKGIVGSPLYMCPHTLSTFYYTAKGDVYALGVSLYQMLANDVPFYDTNMENLISKKMAFDPFHSNIFCSSNTMSLLAAMMTQNPESRPSPQELVRLIEYYFPNLKMKETALNFKREATILKKPPNTLVQQYHQPYPVQQAQNYQNQTQAPVSQARGITQVLQPPILNTTMSLLPNSGRPQNMYNMQSNSALGNNNVDNNTNFAPVTYLPLQGENQSRSKRTGSNGRNPLQMKFLLQEKGSSGNLHQFDKDSSFSNYRNSNLRPMYDGSSLERNQYGSNLNRTPSRGHTLDKCSFGRATVQRTPSPNKNEMEINLNKKWTGREKSAHFWKRENQTQARTQIPMQNLLKMRFQ